MHLRERPFLTLKEAAEILNLSAATIMRAINRGEFPGIKIGSRYRIDPKDFEDYLEKEKLAQIKQARKERRIE